MGKQWSSHGQVWLTLIIYFIYSLPVKFVMDPSETRMYEGLGDSAWEFEKKNMTYNSHRFGISPKTFESD